jgi:hypothetical protein
MLWNDDRNSVVSVQPTYWVSPIGSPFGRTLIVRSDYWHIPLGTGPENRCRCSVLPLYESGHSARRSQFFKDPPFADDMDIVRRSQKRCQEIFSKNRFLNTIATNVGMMGSLAVACGQACGFCGQPEKNDRKRSTWSKMLTESEKDRPDQTIYPTP